MYDKKMKLKECEILLKTPTKQARNYLSQIMFQRMYTLKVNNYNYLIKLL